jgi:hypothetical protein
MLRITAIYFEQMPTIKSQHESLYGLRPLSAYCGKRSLLAVRGEPPTTPANIVQVYRAPVVMAPAPDAAQFRLLCLPMASVLPIEDAGPRDVVVFSAAFGQATA